VLTSVQNLVPAITICIAAAADALTSSWARMIAIESFHCHASLMIVRSPLCMSSRAGSRCNLPSIWVLSNTRRMSEPMWHHIRNFRSMSACMSMGGSASISVSQQYISCLWDTNRENGLRKKSVTSRVSSRPSRISR
jgi:hypothetical protein